MTPEQLKNYQFSYFSKEVMLLLSNAPTLDVITEIRGVLDLLTDSIIQKNMEKLDGFSK